MGSSDLTTSPGRSGVPDFVALGEGLEEEMMPFARVTDWRMIVRGLLDIPGGLAAFVAQRDALVSMAKRTLLEVVATLEASEPIARAAVYA